MEGFAASLLVSVGVVAGVLFVLWILVIGSPPEGGVKPIIIMPGKGGKPGVGIQLESQQERERNRKLDKLLDALEDEDE